MLIATIHKSTEIKIIKQKKSENKKIKPTIKLKYLYWPLFFILTLFTNQSFAQLCGGSGCNTNYANFGLNSNNDAKSIEYDNFVSGFHATVIRTGTGKFKIWGEFVQNNGASNFTSPQEVSTALYNYTGTPLKMTIGGEARGFQQFFLLTTTGLYAWGKVHSAYPANNVVLSNDLKNTTNFASLTVDGRANGLPPGVNPDDVKVLTATLQNLAILTCSGEVWMLTQQGANAGIGITSSNLKWNRVTKVGGAILNNIVALRVQARSAFALQENGDLWTWGSRVYDGVNAPTAQSRAVPVAKPAAGKTIKMIGITNNDGAYGEPSYYVLHTDGSLFAMGANSRKQLGNWHPTNASSDTWVQPKYSSAAGSEMNDIKWISPNDHDGANGAINVLTTNGTLYNWGINDGRMLGRTQDFELSNPAIPNGVTAADKMLVVVTGGHTSMAIKLNEAKMGYAGHYVGGSTGNSAFAETNDYIPEFRFIDTFIEVCGTQTPLVQNISACGTLNLNNAITNASATPADAVIKWFNGSDPTTATEITNITSVAPGTYYAFYYYSYLVAGVPKSNYSAASTAVVASLIGDAGSNAPNIINAPANYYDEVSSAYRIPCGATTANLTPLTASNKPTPASVVLTWHSAAIASNANKLTAAQFAAVNGATRKIYAAFWDNVNGCYSPTQEITIYAPICATDDDFTATPIISSSGGVLPSIFTNDTFKGTAVATLGPNSVTWLGENWIPANAQVDLTNVATYGRLTIPANLAPGVYEYQYSINDNSSSAVSGSSKALAKVKFKVVSCTNPPATGTPDSYAKTGVSSLKGFANGWPTNIPNGFIAIESKTNGFVITRITSTATITNPVEGMLVYDLSSSTVKLYYNSAWHSLNKDCN